MHSINKSAAEIAAAVRDGRFQILLRTTEFAAEFSGSSTRLYAALPRTLTKPRRAP
jgi:hypothetical protein